MSETTARNLWPEGDPIGRTILQGDVLFGVSPADPIGIGRAALLVLGVALVAGVMAAWPATRTDPTATLRHE